MTDGSKVISKLKTSRTTRKAYILGKLSVLVPSQIRALRLRFNMPRQIDLAAAAGLHQSRISMFETPGTNPTLETLAQVAAGLRVGLIVKFAPFSEMLRWENEYSQDTFNVTQIDNDVEFVNPGMSTTPSNDNALLREASRVSGISGEAAVVRAGLEALIARESTRRLAALGGSAPGLRRIRRRRPQARSSKAHVG